MVTRVETVNDIPELPQDSLHAARKRVRDKRTVSQMISIYCRGKHKDVPRDHVAHCGEPVCAECAEIDAYAILRTEQCARMEVKISCDRCPLHCAILRGSSARLPSSPARETWQCHTSAAKRAGSVAVPRIWRTRRGKRGSATYPTHAARFVPQRGAYRYRSPLCGEIVQINPTKTVVYALRSS